MRCEVDPQGEHTGDLEHTSHHHRSGMDECTDRCRTLHGIRQPDVQWEHGTLTGTTNEHQHKCRRDDETSRSQSTSDIALDERCGTLTHHHLRTMTSEGEAERIGIIAEHQDTDEEEHIGEARHDEGLLRSSDGGLQRIVETDEQVGTDTHEFPEHIHLEDVRGEHQTQHRHREEAQESVVTLKALLTVHVAE